MATVYRSGGVIYEDDTTTPVWVSRARSLIPREHDLRPLLTRVRDQQDSSMCVAFAFACVKEFQERKNIDVRDYFSPEYIYCNRNGTGDGMHVRNACDILYRKGCPLEASYPFGMGKPPSREVDDQASNFKISHYARVNTQQELKTAIIEQGPCIISFNMYNTSMHFWRQQDGDRHRGGHAVAIVGYSDENRWFILRNSWGNDWGDHGYCYYPYSEWGKHKDIYVTVDASSSHVYTIVKPPKIDKKGCCVLM